MYKISVPIFLKRLERSRREEVVEQLKAEGVSRVFFSIVQPQYDKNEKKRYLEEPYENTVFMKSEGFGVGT